MQTVEAITHGAVLERPEVLGEALVDEATRMLVGYLGGPSGPGRLRL